MCSRAGGHGRAAGRLVARGEDGCSAGFCCARACPLLCDETRVDERAAGCALAGMLVHTPEARNWCNAETDGGGGGGRAVDRGAPAHNCQPAGVRHLVVALPRTKEGGRVLVVGGLASGPAVGPARCSKSKDRCAAARGLYPPTEPAVPLPSVPPTACLAASGCTLCLLLQGRDHPS